MLVYERRISKAHLLRLDYSQNKNNFFLENITFSFQDKELQQIFQGQSAIREVLTELHRKMDDIVARQDRSLQVLGAIQVKRDLWNFLTHYSIELFCN